MSTPQDLGSYQERPAGPEGWEAADCILFYSRGDYGTIRAIIPSSRKEYNDPAQKDIAYRKAGVMLDYCETTGCRRKFLLTYFGEAYPEERCGGCDGARPPEEGL